jgi:hypothetical protein
MYVRLFPTNYGTTLLNYGISHTKKDPEGSFLLITLISRTSEVHMHFFS